MNNQANLLVILGPTSSGKTKLAVKLAKLWNGEIISADSRQVYRGMDIGTGKDLQEYGKIPHHLIDIIKPQTKFSVARYQKLAYQAINKVLQKNKLPILAGGTGLYIDAVTKGYQLSDAKPDLKLRAGLNKKTLARLLTQLKKLDKNTFDKIDQKNKRRVVRALEIILTTGKQKPIKLIPPPYEILIIGINVEREELNKRIAQRLLQRLRHNIETPYLASHKTRIIASLQPQPTKGIIVETKKLHQQGISWKRLDDFGLEYRFASRYLRGLITYEEMVERLTIAIQQFAKRQMTWFKRNPDIHWVSTEKQTLKLIKKFLNKKTTI